MTLLARLRAWLCPYPDAAEMQAAMLAEITLIRAHRVAAKRCETLFQRLKREADEIGFQLYGSKS